jgi:hypothetical protein
MSSRQEIRVFRKHDAVAARPKRFGCVFEFVFVVCVMLIAAPGIGNAGLSDSIALRQTATDVGRVVGAASVCPEISWQRIEAMTDKFSDLINASVTNGEEYSSVRHAYDQSITESQRRGIARQIPCRHCRACAWHQSDQIHIRAAVA